ncbi:MAG: hypothetical protein LBE38_01955 [Deltaproteobacteria bacterium]|jgi:hypothetical protein|nr:hypothetical protein [Deltaproteobacteria bacterium]
MYTKKKTVFGKAACLIISVMMFLFLLSSCGEEPTTLKVELEEFNGVPTSFRFVDTSTGKEIYYTTIIFDGQPVYKAVAMSSGVYFAFDESQYKVEGNTTTFSGGIMITPAAQWNYTITDVPECKPGSQTRSSECELTIINSE